MSVIDDTRKVLQDVIAPDLKAINVRLDGVERVMALRFEQVDKRLEQIDKRIEERFAQSDRRMEERFAQSDRRMEERTAQLDKQLEQSEKLTQAKFDQVVARIELLTSVVASNHEAVMNAMDLNRRMERIELSIAPQGGPGLLKS